jgi:glycosyltransferase involved in cell wall biosynthesis
MSENPLVSCVISTHNRPDLLGQSINSVCNQRTTLPFDLVVVDDLGQLDTREVVSNARNAARVPITYVARSGPNGASASRNYGAANTDSEFIAFLDDDDLWDEQFLEKSVSELVSSGLDMAVTWMNVLDPSGVIAPLSRIRPLSRPTEVAAWNVGLTGSNFVIKRSVFEVLDGFDPELRVSNDKDFLVRFLSAGFKYAVVPEFLAIHRRHNGPQLTEFGGWQAAERRASGEEAYFRKHKAMLDLASRRLLMKNIHRQRMRASRDPYRKSLHALGFAANISVSDLKHAWRNRNRVYPANRD